MPGEPTRYGIWGSATSDVFILGHTGSIPKGGYDDRKLLHFDGGDWANMDIGLSTPLYGIWGSDDSNVFAAGDTGTIVHYNGSGWSTMTIGWMIVIPMTLALLGMVLVGYSCNTDAF